MTSVCEDKALLDAWHPIAALVDIEPGRTYATRLLGEPLDTRAETPIKVNKSSIRYRRWLSDLGVTYTTIPVL